MCYKILRECSPRIIYSATFKHIQIGVWGFHSTLFLHAKCLLLLGKVVLRFSFNNDRLTSSRWHGIQQRACSIGCQEMCTMTAFVLSKYFGLLCIVAIFQYLGKTKRWIHYYPVKYKWHHVVRQRIQMCHEKYISFSP